MIQVFIYLQYTCCCGYIWQLLFRTQHSEDGKHVKYAKEMVRPQIS